MYQPVLIAVIVVVGYVPAVLPQTRCEVCTFQADENIKILGDLLKNTVDPYRLSFTACNCVVANLYDMYRTPGYDVCEYILANGDKVLHHNITFTNLTIMCDCKLPNSFMDLTTDIFATLAYLKEPCSSGSTAANNVNIQLKSLSLTEIRKLGSCAKLPSISAGSTEGRIVAYWLGPQIALRHVDTPTGRQYVDNFKLSDDYSNFTSKCEGPPLFDIACTCLVDSDVIRRSIIHAVQAYAANCYIKGRNNTYPLFDYYLRCDD